MSVVELRPNRGTPYDQAVSAPKPKRTPTKSRKEALRRANDRRYAFARFRRSLAAMDKREARLFVADMLEQGIFGPVRHAQLDELLLAVPGVGEAWLFRVLWRRQPPIWPRKKLGELTFGQRVFVAGELRKTGR